MDLNISYEKWLSVNFAKIEIQSLPSWKSINGHNFSKSTV